MYIIAKLTYRTTLLLIESSQRRLSLSKEANRRHRQLRLAQRAFLPLHPPAPLRTDKTRTAVPAGEEHARVAAAGVVDREVTDRTVGGGGRDRGRRSGTS